MSTKLILYFLKYGTSFIYYLFAIWLFGSTVNEVYNLIKNDSSDFTKIEHTNFTETFNGAGNYKQDSIYNFSVDKIIKYQRSENSYLIKVKTNSKIGIYNSCYWIIRLCFITGILWILKNIFNDINLSNPFKYSMVKKLKLLAIGFILYDIIEIANHFALNYLIEQSLVDLKLLEQSGFGGGDIVKGLIIFIIAIIYQRGVEIYEENTLTV